ncbi:MAG: universal stress protein, partial [Spirochaetaceae bacterium]|nr:universal stress protein [Spirochaetaceae bacterium]
VAALFDVETVMAGASIFFIFLFNIVTFYGMKIRTERGHELEYGFLIPFFPIVPIISILSRTLIGIFLLDMALWAYIIAGIWLLIGLLFFVIHPKRQISSPLKVEKLSNGESDEDRDGKQVLVALANSETAPILLKYARVFAETQKAGLSLTTIVQVPYQTPIDMAGRFTGQAEKLLTTIGSLSSQIPVQTYLRYAHNTAEGIIQSVRSRNANLLILGWRGFTSRKNYRMGSTLDPVIEKASCDLVVIKAGNEEPGLQIRKILCPTKGKGPHGKLAWDLVKQLALACSAEVTIMHVTPLDKTGSIPEQLKEALSVEYEGMKYKVKIMQSSDPVARIQSESKEYDLVVIGASELSVFQRILFGSKPRKIADKCSCTVMMVRKNTGIRSWFKRWFVS